MRTRSGVYFQIQRYSSDARVGPARRCELDSLHKPHVYPITGETEWRPAHRSRKSEYAHRRNRHIVSTADRDGKVSPSDIALRQCTLAARRVTRSAIRAGEQEQRLGEWLVVFGLKLVEELVQAGWGGAGITRGWARAVTKLSTTTVVRTNVRIAATTTRPDRLKSTGSLIHVRYPVQRAFLLEVLP